MCLLRGGPDRKIGGPPTGELAHRFFHIRGGEEEQEEDEEQKEEEEQEEVDPEPPITDAELEQGEEDQEGKEGEQEPSRQWCSWDWEVVMGEEEQLTYDDPQVDSDATTDGHSPRCPTPHELGSPMEAVVEVHARESEVEDL